MQWNKLEGIGEIGHLLSDETVNGKNSLIIRNKVLGTIKPYFFEHICIYRIHISSFTLISYAVYS